MKTTRNYKLIAKFMFAFSVWSLLAWIAAEELIIEKPLSKADAILVLSGSGAYIERSQKAAEVFKKGIAPKIYLTNDGMRSGWVPKEQRNPYSAERARSALIWYGVPDEAIEILPPVVHGTKDEANLFAQVAAERNLQSLLLVTSAYHTRRTLRTFERESAKRNDRVEIGISFPPPGIQTPEPFRWWLSSIGWKSVAGEYVKTFYYWLFY